MSTTSPHRSILVYSGRLMMQGALALALIVSGAGAACAQKKTQKAAEGADAPAATSQGAPAGAGAPAGEGPGGEATSQAPWRAVLTLEEPLPGPARAALEAGRWREAIGHMEAPAEGAPPRPYHAIARGYAAMRAGEPKICLEEMERGLAQETVLQVHAHAWATECAFDLEDWEATARHAAQVPPSSDRHARALFLLGEGLARAGEPSDLERAAVVLGSYLREYPRGSDSLEARQRVAELMEAGGARASAAVHYNDIITYHPLAAVQVRAAIEALGALKPELDTKTREAIEATSDEQRMARLRALFARHRSEQVLADGERYLKLLDRGSPESCEALYLVGKSLTKLRRHTDSLPWYERVIEECEGSRWVIKARYLIGRGAWNAGSRDRARAAFERIWSEYPEHSYADDAMFYSARILRSQDEPEKMRALLRRQVRAYPSGDMAKDAHWLLVRDLLERKKYTEVVEYVSGVEDPGEHDLYSAGRLRYFAARAQEARDKKEQARALYGEVAREHPLGYYAMLSMSRLAALAGHAPGQTADVCALEGGALCAQLPRGAQGAEAIELPAQLLEAPGLARGAALLQLGLKGPAQREFRALRRAHAGDPAQLWALAMLLDAAGAYPLSHNIPRREIDGWRTSYPGEGTRQRWQIAYPRPFQELVGSWSKRRGIEPQLVWAIMREESGFEPGIESWANARGLLQLIEPTARTVAKKDGLEGFAPDDLFDPQVSVRLGTAYMGALSELFGGHPALIIAGYNGGEANVERWLEQRGQLALDLWVEEIPYGQTRKYTKRVLTTYWTYHWLYGGGRTPGLASSLEEEAAASE